MANSAISVAATGVHVAQKNVETIAHNVANVQTTGFKAFSLISTDLIYQTDRKAGVVNNNANNTITPASIQRGTGAKVNATVRNEAQGELINTNNPLDIALTVSHSYLAVTVEDFANARGYTRNGRLTMNPTTRMLTDMSGNPVEGDIVIPDNVPLEKVSISNDGVISYDDGNGGSAVIAELPVYTFPNSAGLEAVSNDTFIETAGSGEGAPIANRRDIVVQKHLEASNVQMIKEMTELIEAQRTHQALTKIMEIANEMEGQVNNIYHS